MLIQSWAVNKFKKIVEFTKLNDYLTVNCDKNQPSQSDQDAVLRSSVNHRRNNRRDRGRLVPNF